jgi:hypothetical protein
MLAPNVITMFDKQSLRSLKLDQKASCFLGFVAMKLKFGHHPALTHNTAFAKSNERLCCGEMFFADAIRTMDRLLTGGPYVGLHLRGRTDV